MKFDVNMPASPDAPRTEMAWDQGEIHSAPMQGKLRNVGELPDRESL